MLPALAQVDDLEVRLGRSIKDGDRATAQAALSDASTLVRTEVGLTWVDAEGALETEIPDVALVVTLSCARRAFVGETFRANDIDGSTFVESPIGRPLKLTNDEKMQLSTINDIDAAFTISTLPADVVAAYLAAS